VNASRGPVIDETALVEHLKANPMFRAGLDVFEDEPFMKPGLAELPNVVVVPHIASASKVTDLLPVSWGLTSKNFGMYSVGLSTYAY
jgi:phosphoglycerate dehydrogenase-like enzyme